MSHESCLEYAGELRRQAALAEEACDSYATEASRLRALNADLLEALEMVRDADDDCKRDGLPTIPTIARAKIVAAIAKAKTPPNRVLDTAIEALDRAAKAGAK